MVLRRQRQLPVLGNASLRRQPVRRPARGAPCCPTVATSGANAPILSTTIAATAFAVGSSGLAATSPVQELVRC